MEEGFKQKRWGSPGSVLYLSQFVLETQQLAQAYPGLRQFISFLGISSRTSLSIQSCSLPCLLYLSTTPGWNVVMPCKIHGGIVSERLAELSMHTCCGWLQKVFRVFSALCVLVPYSEHWGMQPMQAGRASLQVSQDRDQCFVQMTHGGFIAKSVTCPAVTGHLQYS